MSKKTKLTNTNQTSNYDRNRNRAKPMFCTVILLDMGKVFIISDLHFSHKNMDIKRCFKNEIANGTKPVLCSSYSTEHFLEIKNNFNNIKTPFDKFRFISRCSGIELIIKDKRYWFEFFGKQITVTDIYIPNSSFARTLHIACT